MHINGKYFRLNFRYLKEVMMRNLGYESVMLLNVSTENVFVIHLRLVYYQFIILGYTQEIVLFMLQRCFMLFYPCFQFENILLSTCEVHLESGNCHNSKVDIVVRYLFYFMSYVLFVPL